MRDSRDTPHHKTTDPGVRLTSGLARPTEASSSGRRQFEGEPECAQMSPIPSLEGSHRCLQGRSFQGAVESGHRCSLRYGQRRGLFSGVGQGNREDGGQHKSKLSLAVMRIATDFSQQLPVFSNVSCDTSANHLPEEQQAKWDAQAAFGPSITV